MFSVVCVEFVLIHIVGSVVLSVAGFKCAGVLC